MERSAPTIPPVVAALADGLAPILGNRLVGVYLAGSASMGDFVPASSDFDVLVVTEGLLAPADLAAIGTLHRELARTYPDARRLEGDYAPRELLVPGGTSAPVPGFLGGRFEPEVDEIMLSADNIANARESGIAVYGPPARTVLPPVTPDELRAAVLEMLREGPGPAASEEDAATEVLSLVRSLCSLETGRPTTKAEGVAWALGHLDERWHEVVRRADAIRRGAPAAEGDTRLRAAFPAMDRAVRPRRGEEDPSRPSGGPLA